MSGPQTESATMFRSVAGHFASGVTVVTTLDDGSPVGTTVSAVSSLSLEPPMMLVCLNRSSATQAAIRKAGVFAVNILAEGQDGIAFRFAGKGPDKFKDVAYRRGITGAPVIDGALAAVECRTSEAVEGGSHTVFLANVVAAAAFNGDPLTYFKGGFGRLERLEEQTAYQKLRAWILQRNVAVGDPVDPGLAAQALGADPSHIRNGLIRLAAEMLVERGKDGAFAVAPVTCELAARLIDARAAMVAGVIDAHLGSAGAEQIVELQELAAKLEALQANPAAGLDDFLSAAERFHVVLVGLARSRPLASAHFRLGIDVVWRRGLGADWRDRLGEGALTSLAGAIAEGDRAAAIEALRKHHRTVRHAAETALREQGGYV